MCLRGWEELRIAIRPIHGLANITAMNLTNTNSQTDRSTDLTGVSFNDEHQFPWRPLVISVANKQSPMSQRSAPFPPNYRYRSLAIDAHLMCNLQWYANAHSFRSCGLSVFRPRDRTAYNMISYRNVPVRRNEWERPFPKFGVRTGDLSELFWRLWMLTTFEIYLCVVWMYTGVSEGRITSIFTVENHSN
jgi:hypothetical protein